MPDNCARFVAYFQEDRTQAYIEHTQQWQRLEGELEVLERRYHEYCEAFETGRLSAETLDARLKALQKERAEAEALKDTAATLARREAKRQKVLGKTLKPSLFRRFLRDVLRKGDSSDQMDLLRGFVHHVLVQPDGLLLVYHPFVLTEGHPFDPDDGPGGGPQKPHPAGNDGVAVSLVARDGIEPPTRGFSVPCSTD